MIEGYERLKSVAEKQKKLIDINLFQYEKLKNMNGEIDDIVDEEYLKYLKLQKIVEKFLCNNIININDDEHYSLFNKYENKVNYMYDRYNVPTFKNTLLKYNDEINNEIKYINEYNSPNYINPKIWSYLNTKKVKMQYLNDKGVNKKIVNEKINTVKLKKNIIKRNNIKEEQKELNDICKKIKTINSFSINDDIEEYLVNKKIYKINSYFASDVLKNIVYKKFC
jgi:hypothetical protein